MLEWKGVFWGEDEMQRRAANIMRIGVNLGPTEHWQAVLEAAQKVDSTGFDSLGFLDHYHTEKPGWGYVCGWSFYGALALQTTRVKLIPQVICRLNYLPGVLAKETSLLALLSRGRFELGIGAGDYFIEMRAWGLSVPSADERIETLKETVQVLRKVWKGEAVTFNGKYLHVQDGLCLPAPLQAPRVLVGVGNSRSLLRSALTYADEVNVYADEDLMREAYQAIQASGREIVLSTFVWEWRADLREKLKEWEQLGVSRTFVTFWEPFERLDEVAGWL